MSSPSSPIDVEQMTFISPLRNFSIIFFCSFWERPVFPFFAWPTKTEEFICGILLSWLFREEAVSLNCVNIIVFEFLFSFSWD